MICFGLLLLALVRKQIGAINKEVKICISLLLSSSNKLNCICKYCTTASSIYHLITKTESDKKGNFLFVNLQLHCYSAMYLIMFIRRFHAGNYWTNTLTYPCPDLHCSQSFNLTLKISFCLCFSYLFCWYLRFTNLLLPSLLIL